MTDTSTNASSGNPENPNNVKRVPIPVLEQVERMWIESCEKANINFAKKRQTGSYYTAEFNFFRGASMAFVADGYEVPARWGILLSCGRSIIEFVRSMEAKKHDLAKKKEEAKV
jgi:hypothetical protein